MKIFNIVVNNSYDIPMHKYCYLVFTSRYILTLNSMNGFIIAINEP